MKVLAIGDTHMNTSAICNVAIPQAKKHGCPIIVQCGDFGYWEHEREGEKFLHKVSKHLVRNDLVMYWIDGNHDNHPKLWADYEPEGPEGLVKVRPHLYYVPRGTVFDLGDVRCLGLGGAFSIDKEWRLYEESLLATEGLCWWPTEMITNDEVLTAIANGAARGPIQIMFTHDCPTGVDVPGIHSVDKWKWPETWENRDRLREVFDALRPRLVVHGHYHVRYSGGLHWQPGPGEALEGCRVEGLSNDGRSGFALVLDLDAMFESQ
jgi:predicted phosphodiesterase